VKSESLGNEMWDNRWNSKRVKLFIHALKKPKTEYDQCFKWTWKEAKNNWDDYVIQKPL
jgi:hypothetical protein